MDLVAHLPLNSADPLSVRLQRLQFLQHPLCLTHRATQSHCNKGWCSSPSWLNLTERFIDSEDDQVRMKQSRNLNSVPIPSPRLSPRPQRLHVTGGTFRLQYRSTGILWPHRQRNFLFVGGCQKLDSSLWIFLLMEKIPKFQELAHASPTKCSSLLFCSLNIHQTPL